MCEREERMKQTLKDLTLNHKTVLVRCDFNVPLDDERKITDDRRIVSSLPTINFLIEKGAKVVLLSHLGRPKGKSNPQYSLAPVAKRLEELLHTPVHFIQDPQVVSEEVKDKVKALKPSDVILLENTRFRAEEEKNGDAFAQDLAELGDVYVNDAFGTSHRAHASNVGLASRLPSAVGFLVQKELDVLQGALEHPKRPFVAIMGGSKVSDKIPVIENLLEKVDSLLIVGGMAYTFLKAQGMNIGKSLCEEEQLEFAKSMLSRAKEKGVQLVLPVDTVVTKDFDDESQARVVEGDLAEDDMGVDIGPKTVALMTPMIRHAGTVIWNGPAGVFEKPAFAKGTEGIAKALAESDAITIIGGGDSAAAVEILGYGERMTHISTGGGASLELLSGAELPGVASIAERD